MSSAAMRRRDVINYAILLRGVIGYAYSRVFKDYQIVFKYWPTKHFIKQTSQILSLKLLGYWSGFLSMARGRHWTISFNSGRWY